MKSNNFSTAASNTNKTRGLRRGPTRETIVLGCKKFNPESTEIFEFKIRNSELFGTRVVRSQECVL